MSDQGALIRIVEKRKADKDLKGLIEIIELWTKPEAQIAAMKALAELKDPKAVQPLIVELRDRRNESGVLYAALEALGRIGDPRAVKPLIRALRKKDESLQAAAAWSLGNIRDPKAVVPLIRLLGSSSKHVLQAAEDALAKIGRPSVKALVKALTNTKTRRGATEVLLRIGAPAVAPVGDLLMSGDTYTRAAAAKILGEIGDASAASALAAAANDRQALVRTRIAEAIRRLRDRGIT